MKIDGVTVEPSPADDPDSLGHTALDIDCDLDALALKVCVAVHSETRFQVEHDGNPYSLLHCRGSHCPAVTIVSVRRVFISSWKLDQSASDRAFSESIRQLQTLPLGPTINTCWFPLGTPPPPWRDPVPTRHTLFEPMSLPVLTAMMHTRRRAFDECRCDFWTSHVATLVSCPNLAKQCWQHSTSSAHGRPVDAPLLVSSRAMCRSCTAAGRFSIEGVRSLMSPDSYNLSTIVKTDFGCHGSATKLA